MFISNSRFHKQLFSPLVAYSLHPVCIPNLAVYDCICGTLNSLSVFMFFSLRLSTETNFLKFCRDWSRNWNLLRVGSWEFRWGQPHMPTLKMISIIGGVERRHLHSSARLPFCPRRLKYIGNSKPKQRHNTAISNSWQRWSQPDLVVDTVYSITPSCLEIIDELRRSRRNYPKPL